MSANLIERRRHLAPERLHASHTVIDRRKRREPMEYYSLPPVTDDEEKKFIANAVIWMAVLAITPWILFYILNFLYPDFLIIPIAPN